MSDEASRRNDRGGSISRRKFVESVAGAGLATWSLSSGAGCAGARANVGLAPQASAVNQMNGEVPMSADQPTGCQKSRRASQFTAVAYETSRADPAARDLDSWSFHGPNDPDPTRSSSCPYPTRELQYSSSKYVFYKKSS